MRCCLGAWRRVSQKQLHLYLELASRHCLRYSCLRLPGGVHALPVRAACVSALPCPVPSRPALWCICDAHLAQVWWRTFWHCYGEFVRVVAHCLVGMNHELPH